MHTKVWGQDRVFSHDLNLERNFNFIDKIWFQRNNQLILSLFYKAPEWDDCMGEYVQEQTCYASLQRPNWSPEMFIDNSTAQLQWVK